MTAGESDDADAAATTTTRLRLRTAVTALLPLLPAALEQGAAEERGARQALTGAARRGRAAKGIADDAHDADAVEQLAKPRRAAEAAETSIFFSFWRSCWWWCCYFLL